MAVPLLFWGRRRGWSDFSISRVWPGPRRESAGRKAHHGQGTITLAAVFFRRGSDWEEELTEQCPDCHSVISAVK